MTLPVLPPPQKIRPYGAIEMCIFY